MISSNKVFIVIALSAALLSFNSAPNQVQKQDLKSHNIDNKQQFIKTLQSKYNEVRDYKSKEDDKKRDKVNQVHRQLAQDYPILYDWWLQDGDDVNWFKGDLSSQVDNRLSKVNSQLAQANKSKSVNEKLDLYLNECVKRR